MTDVLPPQQRSFNMSQIRGRDTKPERIVRSIVHRMGYRFRLHRRDLPGKPDLVFPKHKKIVLIHGCFWHLPACRYGRVIPKTNAEFWSKKRASNKARDKMTLRALRKAGFQVLTLWECQTRNAEAITEIIKTFLST